MGGGGPVKSTSGTDATIAPELQPLYGQTGTTVQGLQSNIAPSFSEFFQPQTQFVPGFSSGQQDINAALRQQAFGPSMTAPQMDAYGSLMTLANSPVGSSPQTIAAMQAIRDPTLNDLAMAGLGNSDAVGTSLGGAYAPILAQEMAQRFQAIPLLNQLGATAYGQQQQNLASYGQSEEARNAIGAAQGEAITKDLLRRQGLGSQFTTGILGGFPALGGSTTVSKQTGGGK